MRIIFTSCLLLLLAASFDSGAILSAQSESQDDMTFTTRKKTGATRAWQTGDVRVEYSDATKTLTVIGYYLTGDPESENPTQEMTLQFRDFDGPGSYGFSGGGAKWEDRNSGSGICTYLHGSGEILESSEENPSLLSGTFDFRCESKPNVGDPFWTDIEGTFTVNVGVEITSPKADEEVKPGSDLLVEWKAPLTSKVDIYYTFEDPETDPKRYEIRKGVDASLGSHKWSVTDSMSPQAWIVIVDPLSPDRPAVSEKFRVRGPHFVKLAYDAQGSCPECPYYLMYSPKVHGWNVVNGDGQKLDPAGRSDSWRFDYATASDPYTGESYPDFFSKPPVSASKHNYPEWPNFAHAFGETALYGFDQEQSRVPIERRVRAWGYWADDYNGSCYGLSSLSSLLFINPESYLQRYPSVGTPSTAKHPYTASFTTALADDISTIFSYQFCIVDMGRQILTRDNGPASVVAELKEYLMQDQPSDLMGGNNTLLIFEDGSNGGGHAVTAYRVEEDEDAGTAKIYVYDSNHPGDENRYVSIDLNANSWSYTVSGTWGEQGADIALAMSLDNFDRVPVQYMKDDEGRIVALASARTLYRGSGDAGEFYYAPETGFVSAGTNVQSVYSFQGPGAPIAYIMDPAYNVLQLQAAADEGASTMILAPAMTFDFWSDVSRGMEDHLRWDDRSVTVTNPESTPHVINLDALFERDGIGRTLGVRSLALSGGDSVRFEISEAEETLVLVNHGAATSYEVLVRRTGDGGLLEGEYRTVDIPQGAEHRLRPLWDSLGSDLPIYITDAGGDEDSIFLDNLLMSVGRESELSLTSFSIDNPIGNDAELQVSLRKGADLVVTLSDMRGAHRGVIFSGWVGSGTSHLPVDISGLPPGIYILGVEVDGRREQSTLISRSE